MKGAQSRRRNSTIDLMKFLFALLIVCFHGQKNLPLGDGLHFFINGRIGVEFFFIVSGYLMVCSSGRYIRAMESSKDFSIWQNTIDFIKHKIVGLSPNVFLAWILAFTVVVIGQECTAMQVLRKFFAGLFECFFIARAGFRGIPSINGATWYLSAMLIGMSILFPLLVKKRDFYIHWFAPLGSLLLYGFMSSSWDNGMAGSTMFTGFATKGLLRALGGLLLGAVCYLVAEKLKSVNYRPFMKVLFTLLLTGSFAFVFRYVYSNKNSSFDFVLVAIIAVGVTLSFANVSYTQLLNRNALVYHVCGWLGEFSMNLFLSHGYWSNYLQVFVPGITGMQLFRIYLAVVFVNAILLMIVSKLILHYWPAIKGMLYRLCIQE